MRGHRAKQSNSSELFLDTITNTFGGILFILLFVVVLLKMTQERSITSESQAVSTIELESRRLELLTLKQQWETMEEQLRLAMEFRDRLISPEKATLFSRWNELKKESEELDRSNSEMLREMVVQETQSREEETKREQLLKQTEQLTQDISHLNRQTEHLKIQWEEAITRQNEETTLPRMTSTSLEQIGLVIRYKRLYLWHRYDSNLNRLSLNEDDFTVIEEEESIIHSTPLPWRGIPINGSNQSQEAIRKLLSRFSPSRFYLTIVVFNDSYSEYHVVSRDFKKWGYRIDPHLISPGRLIIDRGGTDSRSQ